jgi:hypothetical protein
MSCMRIPHPASRIPNPESRIPNPESRIPNRRLGDPHGVTTAMPKRDARHDQWPIQVHFHVNCTLGQ